MHARPFGDLWQGAGDHRMTGQNTGIAPCQISVHIRMLLDGNGRHARVATDLRSSGRTGLIFRLTAGAARHISQRCAPQMRMIIPGS